MSGFDMFARGLGFSICGRVVVRGKAVNIGIAGRARAPRPHHNSTITTTDIKFSTQDKP
jgi:hypothetical protein